MPDDDSQNAPKAFKAPRAAAEMEAGVVYRGRMGRWTTVGGSVCVQDWGESAWREWRAGGGLTPDEMAYLDEHHGPFVAISRIDTKAMVVEPAFSRASLSSTTMWRW